jgi:hypothetical protein
MPAMGSDASAAAERSLGFSVAAPVRRGEPDNSGFPDSAAMRGNLGRRESQMEIWPALSSAPNAARASAARPLVTQAL